MAQEPAVTPRGGHVARQLIRVPFLRWAALLAAVACISLYIGFLCFDSAKSEWLVRNLAYGWMLVLFSGWLAAVLILFRRERPLLRTLWPGRYHALMILVAWLWVMRMDPFGYKVLFDEPVQVSTALTLHQDRELASTVRGFSVSEIFTVLTSHLDKRPPSFPFLVATLHDLSGYRLANAYIVNGLGTLLLLFVAWHLGRQIAGHPAGGICLVGLLATLPVLGVTATGAGMDLLNLTFLTILGLCAVGYVSRPSAPRLSLMVLSSMLLAYTRYESVLYVATAALVWLGVVWRDRRWCFMSVWIIMPLALILYGWHNTVLSNSPALWELRENQTQRFSLEYAPNNLRHAGKFLFNTGRNIPNSVFLSTAGLAGGILVLVQLLRRRAVVRPGIYIALGAVAAGVLANFAVLMCYYWGELDDPIVTRLSLPFHLLLASLAVAGWTEWRAVKPGWGSWKTPLAGVGIALLIWTIPTITRHRYTERDLMRDNFEWERRVVASYWPPPGLVISSRSPICWLAERIPSLSFERVRLREDGVKWHLAHHSFGKVLVMQRVLTSGRDAEWGVDMTQQLPSRWRLKEVAVRRMGLTLTRISELVAIEPTEGATEGQKEQEHATESGTVESL